MIEHALDVLLEGRTAILIAHRLNTARRADRIVVVDHGRAIAEGTAAELKRQTGGARLEVTITEPDPAAAYAREPFAAGEVRVGGDGRRLGAPVRNSAGLATAVVRALDDAGIAVDDVEIRQPSLDDVFFALTGHPTDADDGSRDERLEAA
jgi:ABC-type multidrug transport system ATPase subunit